MRMNGLFHKHCFTLAKIAAIIVAGILFVGIGLPAVADTVSGDFNLSEEELATIAALESMGYEAEYYRNRQEEISRNRERLLAKGEYEERLDFCAELLFIRENAEVFVD